MLTVTRRIPGRGMSAIVPASPLFSIGIGRLGDDTTPVTPYDIASRLQAIAMTYMNSIDFAVEQGSAMSASDVQNELTNTAQQTCAEVPGSCTVPTDLISQLVAQYSAALQAKQNSFNAQVAAGQVTIPGGSSYVAPLPPPVQVTVAPPAPAATYTAPNNALDRVVPTATPITVAQPTTVLAPPTSNPNVTTQSLANTLVQSAAPVLSTTGGTATPAPSWIDDNWPILAAAAGLLIIFGMRKGN